MCREVRGSQTNKQLCLLHSIAGLSPAENSSVYSSQAGLSSPVATCLKRDCPEVPKQ